MNIGSNIVNQSLNQNVNTSQSCVMSQQNWQKLIDVYDQLKRNEETYWQALEGLTSDQKVEIFIRILRKVTSENRSDFQLRFLSSMCMHFEFFKNISQNYGNQVVKDCVRYLRYEDLQNDQILFEQGERGTRFYIILQGSVHILIKLPEKGNVKKFKNQRINTIHAGKAFGEVALMNDNTMRTATIKSAEYCRFAYLEKEDFKRIIGKEATEQINQRYMFIKDYNFFDEFTYRELMTFSYHFNEATYKRGQVVYDIFDKKIDDVYFVKEGSFMLQGSFDFTDSYIPNLKVKTKQKVFNIDPLIQRTIFGLEHFNKDVIKSMHYAIKSLEELSNAAIQKSKEFKNGISQNPDNEEGEKLIPFQPYRIGRVICDSTRGTVYRVKASEIEQRLWKEDSKVKWNALSTLIFEKQVFKIQQFIQKSLEEKSHLELLREQAKYLKPSVEYIGRKEDLKQLQSPENHRNSQSRFSIKTLDQKLEVRSSSPSLLKNGGSPMNNNISILLDLDKFYKSSIDFGFSDRSPFNKSIQKIKLTLQSSGQSPSRLKTTIQPCIQNSTSSPRKPVKNVTINDLTTIESNTFYNNVSPLARRNNFDGKGSHSSLNKSNKSNKNNNHKSFSLCVFNADENNQSVILSSKRNTNRKIICEEESSEENLGSSIILFKRQTSKALLKSSQSLSSDEESHIVYHKQRIESIKNEKEEDDETLQNQKTQQKQCSPPKRSPEKQTILQEKELIKSERNFKRDFLKQIQKSQTRASSTVRQVNNQSEKQGNQMNPLNKYKRKKQDQQKEKQTIQQQNLKKESTKQDDLKQENSKQNNEGYSSPKEILDKIFYFSHKRNKVFQREQEVQMMKKYFLGDDPEETNPSNVIRGKNGNGLNIFDQDLLEATTLDDYKRRKFQRKLLQEQENKFQKLFSNDLVELGKLNEMSLYNQKVKELYIRNRKMNKKIFDKTAEVVKYQNCSYMQVREFYNKQDHKDRFFQDIYLKKASSPLQSAKNIKNISARVQTYQLQRITQQKSSNDLSHQTLTQSIVSQNNSIRKKAASQFNTPHKARQSKLVIKDKISISQFNQNNSEQVHSLDPDLSNFQLPKEIISDLKQDLKKSYSTHEKGQEVASIDSNIPLKKAYSVIMSQEKQPLDFNLDKSIADLKEQQEESQFSIQKIIKDETHIDVEQDKDILQTNKEIQNPEYQRDIDMLQQKPDYLTYLLQKNIQQNKVEKIYENMSKIDSPMIISNAVSIKNDQIYDSNSAQKKQNNILKESKEQKIKEDQNINEEQSQNDKITLESVNQIDLNNEIENDREDDQNNYIQYYSSQIQDLLQAEGIPSLSQNHLTHQKYTPNYKSYSQKQNNFGEKRDDSSINFSNDQIQSSIQISSSQLLKQKKQLGQENLSNQTSQLNSSNILNKTNSQLNQSNQLNQSLYSQNKYKRYNQEANSQALTPIVIENFNRISNRSFVGLQQNYKPPQLSISFSNSSQKQEINIEDKNTFLSQNHRKYIPNSRQQQRELFLKSKSSVNRFTSSTSTKCGDSNVFSSQVDVNSKCLSKIPTWNHRPNTSQTVQSFKKQQKIPKNRGPIKSLQIVSNNSVQSDNRLLNTLSQDQSIILKRVNTDPNEGNNQYQKYQTQLKNSSNYQFTQY